MQFQEYLNATYFGNTISQYLTALGIALLAIIVGKLLSLLVRSYIRKFAAKTKTSFDDILVNSIDKPLVFFVFVWGLFAGIKYLTVPKAAELAYINTIQILFTVAVTWFMLSFIDQIIAHYLIPITKKTESEIDDHLVPFVRKFVKVFIILIALIMIVSKLGYNVTSLVTGLGIGGLAVALAAQSLLGNIIGGLTIIWDKPFKVGDRIRIDKYDGSVKEIGMRSTRIETLDGSQVSIPNQLISSNSLENITKERARRIRFDLGLVYSTSSEKIDKAKDIVKEIITKNKYAERKENKKEPNMDVFFSGFGPSSLNITVVYFIDDKDNVAKAQDEINLEIKKRFEKAGIEFAYPTQTVYLRKE